MNSMIKNNAYNRKVEPIFFKKIHEIFSKKQYMKYRIFFYNYLKFVFFLNFELLFYGFGKSKEMPFFNGFSLCII